MVVILVNFILYNLDISLLKEYGFYLRIIYFLINMLLLYGLLVLVLYVFIVRVVIKRKFVDCVIILLSRRKEEGKNSDDY